MNNEDFQTLIRYLWALSLVPTEDIVTTWEEVVRLQYDLLKPSFEEDSETVDKFLEYFEKTWIGSLNWRTGARKKQMFPHAVWNKYNSVLSEDPLTSNAEEGYNSALALSLPKNASIRALVQQLRTEETSISRKMRDALLGAQNNGCHSQHQPQPGQDAKEDRFEEPCISSYTRKVSLKQYMKAIVDFYNN